MQDSYTTADGSQVEENVAQSVHASEQPPPQVLHLPPPAGNSTTSAPTVHPVAHPVAVGLGSIFSPA